MKLLDRTVLIHYWGGREETKTYLESHEDSEFVTTTLTLKEIAVGLALQGEPDRGHLRRTFGWVQVVPFRTDHAIVAGLEADLWRDDAINQDKLDTLTGDLLIAAVAKDLGATVVTETVVDFELFDGVSVEGYF